MGCTNICLAEVVKLFWIFRNLSRVHVKIVLKKLSIKHTFNLQGGFEHPSGHYVKLAGCIDDTHDSHSCIDEENCHADAVENDSRIHFCCCEGNLCNTNLTYR